ncbi:DNA polymerase delta subunit 2 [Fusarium oxysporum f. sp. albedinis]|nr:DNA polymerase delta subunit 2 [Fusarium oxysporum f. sp. albedinis]
MTILKIDDELASWTRLQRKVVATEGVHFSKVECQSRSGDPIQVYVTYVVALFTLTVFNSRWPVLGSISSGPLCHVIKLRLSGKKFKIITAESNTCAPFKPCSKFILSSKKKLFRCHCRFNFPSSVAPLGVFVCL